MRYSTARILQDEDKRRRFNTIIFPPMPEANGDLYIQITTPDRLDKLAYIFYDNASLWWVIAAANSLGKGSYIVPINTRLRIPAKINIDDYVIEINRNR